MMSSSAVQPSSCGGGTTLRLLGSTARAADVILFKAGRQSATASTSAASTSKAWVVRHTSAIPRTTRFCVLFSHAFDHAFPNQPPDLASCDEDVLVFCDV
eukprot:jgi/Pico_ML_1/54399/g4753.t1